MNNIEIKRLQSKYNLSEDYIKDNVKCVHTQDECGCRNKEISNTYFDIARNRYLNIRV